VERLKDVSEWYTPERVEADEVLGRATTTGGFHDYAAYIKKVCDEYGLRTVIEVGCGAGWVPSVLPFGLAYTTGIDANEYMLAKARARCPMTNFMQSDIRRVNSLGLVYVDLVCSFGVLKHFALNEWADILTSVLSLGRFGLFTQHVFTDDRESIDVPGKDEHGVAQYHDIWVSSKDLTAAVTGAGHRILQLDVGFRWDGAMDAPEAMIVTEVLPQQSKPKPQPEPKPKPKPVRKKK
jgi:SAM-dependent methyltransferase